MALRVAFKLREEEIPAVLKFANDVGLEVAELARRALFMTMQAAYSPQGGNTTQQGNIGETIQADVAGTSTEARSGQDVTPDSLADKT